MTDYIVSIRDAYTYAGAGSAYYTVVCDATIVTKLEQAAEAAGLKAVVRRADDADKALRWMREVADE